MNRDKQEKKSKLEFSVSISPKATDEELLFARQLGVERVYTWVPEDQMDAGFLTKLRQKVDDAGLKLHNVGNMGVGKCDKIQLALPERDERIEAFKQFLRAEGFGGGSRGRRQQARHGDRARVIAANDPGVAGVESKRARARRSRS